MHFSVPTFFLDVLAVGQRWAILRLPAVVELQVPQGMARLTGTGIRPCPYSSYKSTFISMTAILT